MKILISVVNGFSLGLRLERDNPLMMVVEEDGEEFLTVGLFKGLTIHLGFLEFKVGDLVPPQFEDTI
jgi:hypothetical protein